jgi:uncharacterized membrane protein
LLHPDWVSHRHFPSASLERIEHVITQSEARHHAEIFLAVETSLNLRSLLRGQTARERALEVFAQQRVWDTETNNGILIYLLLADRDVEIVADRGITKRLDAGVFDQLCHVMKAHFQDKAYETGVVQVISLIHEHLVKLDPPAGADVNELPNRPILI